MIYLLLAPIIIVVVFVIVSPRPTKLKLTGAHVLVTGGSSGIGLEIAKYCASKGAFITIVARNQQKLDEAKLQVEKCMAGGGDKQCVITVQLDVASSFEEIAKSIQIAEKRLGPVDALVNCAGVSYAQAFEDTPIDKFDWLMKINYIGSVFCTKAVLPGMKQRRQGRIVFVSSQAGQIGVFGYTGYSASKFALRGFAEALQMEVRPYNIAITVSYPPDTDTPGFHLEGGTKPEETRLISETSGLFPPEVIAKSLVRDMVQGEFDSIYGIDGFMLGHLCAGMGPCNSSMSALLEIFLMGAFRLVGLAYQKNFNSIILRQMRSKQETINNSSENIDKNE